MKCCISKTKVTTHSNAKDEFFMLNSLPLIKESNFLPRKVDT